MKKHQVFFVICTLFVFLVSCQESSQKSAYSDECIPPSETFVYSASPNLEKIPGNPEMQIPPNWQVEMDVPNNYKLLLSRATGNNVELWFDQIIYSVYNSKTPWTSYTKIFHIYDLRTKKIETISADVERSGVFAQYLFMAPDGSIWAQNDIAIINSIPGGENYPILSKFNEASRQFEFVSEAKVIPSFPSINKKDNPSYWVSMVVDTSGLLWFLVPEDAVYSYDPAKKEVKKHIEIHELAVRYPVPSPDGSIYFLDQKILLSKDVVTSSSDIKIYKFSPKAESLEMIPVRLDPWPPFSTILADHKGRLWIDGLAYREPDGRLYQLERSPIFLVYYFESGMDYRWVAPDILMESSDGRLWFRSRNGLAWLDLDEQKWCWLSTSLSKIVEDQQNNLWMIAYGKLYKTQITPKN